MEDLKHAIHVKEVSEGIKFVSYFKIQLLFLIIIIMF